MIKYLFKSILLVFFLANNLMAQDLIVTDSGDSINCKITKIKNEMIYFVYKQDNEIRNTLIPVKKTVNHQYNYYNQPEVSLKEVQFKDKYSHWRFGLDAGYLYYAGGKNNESDPAIRKYFNGLRSGLVLGGDMTYYFTEMFGIGIKYNSNENRGKMYGVTLSDENGTIVEVGTLNDIIKTTYIAPSFSTRFYSGNNNNNAFFMNIGFGWLNYNRTESFADSYYYNISGSTIGCNYDLGYDISLSKYFALGFQASYTMGVLSSYTLNDGTSTTSIYANPEEYINTSHFTLTVGLRFTTPN